jgi:AcrR family transcriptional regulator
VSTPPRPEASRLRTPAAILEAAAHVFAERGGAASMADVADAAGVGRATLYRYYPSRDALLEALSAEALDEAATRIADAGLDAAPVDEAIERIVRAIVAVGDRYAVLVREQVQPDAEEVERRLAEPIRRVFQRGLDSGLLRDDLPLDVHLVLFGGILQAGAALAGQHGLGLEDTSAAVTTTFLDGARRREQSPAA